MNSLEKQPQPCGSRGKGPASSVSTDEAANIVPLCIKGHIDCWRYSLDAALPQSTSLAYRRWDSMYAHTPSTDQVAVRDLCEYCHDSQRLAQVVYISISIGLEGAFSLRLHRNEHIPLFLYVVYFN